jgi:hypothetical protein
VDDPGPNTRQADEWRKSEKAERTTVFAVDLAQIKKEYGLELEGVH